LLGDKVMVLCSKVEDESITEFRNVWNQSQTRIFRRNTSAEGRPRLHSWESQKPLILTGYNRLSQATYLGMVAQLINNELKKKLGKKTSSAYLLKSPRAFLVEV